MLTNFMEFFRQLFKRRPRTTDAEQAANTEAVMRYEDITETNLTAMVAGKIANLVVADAIIQVTGDNPRARFLNESLERFLSQFRSVVARELGTGGVVVKPYNVNGELHTNVASQDRFFVVEQVGDVVTKAGLISEIFYKNDHTYMRAEYHTLDDGVLTIEQKGTIDDKEVPLESVPEWAAISPKSTVYGVERMLFSFLKCPTDNRRQFMNVYGVPITYGQGKLISEITRLLNEFQKELIRKGVFVGIADALFKSNNQLPDDGLFKMFRSDKKVGEGGNWFDVFSPDIRDQSYINAINYRMELLEKAIGVNKGVLTNLDTQAATATEIKRSTFDTFTLVKTIQSGLERSIRDLVYAYDVIANAAGLAPYGEYEVTFDWSYSLLEDSAQTWNQYITGLGAGVLRAEEVRAWLLNITEAEALTGLPELQEDTGQVGE